MWLILDCAHGKANYTRGENLRALGRSRTDKKRGLLIDLVAQTGHYPPNATDLFPVHRRRRKTRLASPAFAILLRKTEARQQASAWQASPSIPRLRDGTVVGQQLEQVLE
jgi:hypothetical protein